MLLQQEKKYSSFSRLLQLLPVFLLLLIGFLYRFTGITLDVPFWVDEFSSGIQARSISHNGLGALRGNELKLEHNNLLTHFVIAGSFSLLGESEQSARLPFVLIGALVPLALFFLARRVTNLSVALSSMLLATFLYPQILWSVQARGYVLLQLLIVLTFWLYLFHIQQKEKRALWRSALLVTCFVLGTLTHSLYVLVLLAITIHLIFTYRNWRAVSIGAWIATGVVGIILITILHLTGTLAAAWVFLSSALLGANNIWYYHSFLWGEYGLVTFLGIVGIVFGLLKHFRAFLLFIIYVLLHLGFIFFGYGHYLSKYLLPVLPLLILGTAVTLQELGNNFSFLLTDFIAKQNYKLPVPSSVLKPILSAFLPVCLALFIVANGHQFITTPKSYYSLNRDFREIANIDYHQVYALIKVSIDTSDTPVAVIETWPDRALWYLGNGYPSVLLFRWQDEGGSVSGHAKVTPFEIRTDGSKYLPWRPTIGFIGKAADLQLAMTQYEKGFIWIDDASLPADVIAFAEENLHKELYLDHYPLDENPYSIWPGTLYSWGVSE